MSEKSRSFPPDSIRDPFEISNAFQVMAMVQAGDIAIKGNRKARMVFDIATDMLCWVLGHPHRTNFADLLHDILAVAKQQGIVAILEDVAPVSVDLLPHHWRQAVSAGQCSIQQAREEAKAFYQGRLTGYRVRTGFCGKCGMKHDAYDPHDPTSEVFVVQHIAKTGLQPTWEDAISDCPERLQGLLVVALNKVGEWPRCSGPIRKPTIEAIKQAIQRYQQQC